jgi:hypothetical protein
MDKGVGNPGVAVALLLLCAAAFACRPSQTVERQTKDTALKAEVKAKLATELGPATVTSIEVNVTNGVVTLAGPVHNDAEKQKAETVARGVEGVTGVNNNLQVLAEPVPAPAGTPTSSGSGPMFVPFPTAAPAPKASP